MAFNLFPKVVKFFQLFQAQNRLVTEGARLLETVFLDNASAGEPCKRINRLEQEGNEQEREIFQQLTQTFITPLDREDIHELNVTQEGLLNLIHGVSVRMGLYRFAEIRAGAKELAVELRRLVDETAVMIEKLGKVQELEDHAITARKIKSEAATLILVSLGELYEHPAQSPADVLEIIQWTQVYDRLEQALSQAEALANLLERISVKNA